MSIIGRTEIHHYEDDIGGGYCLGSENESPPRGSSSMLTPCTDKEKRIRREIANSNERRRMQSINAGFQSLRTLLPRHEGEKLSKAAILQQTTDYIYALEQEKTGLLAQNCQLKRLIAHERGESECTVSKKRKTESGVVVVESTEEGLTEDGMLTGGNMLDSDDAPLSPNNQELIDIRIQLDRERGLRLLLEEKLRALQSKLYPEKIREMAHQVHVQYETEEELSNVVLRRGSSAIETEDPMDMDMESDTASGSGLEINAPHAPHVAHTETVVATPLSPVPLSHCEDTTSTGVPTLLSASMIKQEPRVEVQQVERIPESDNSSCNSEDAVQSHISSSCSVTIPTSVSSQAPLPRSKVFLASASRPNLETIVEAIRHLEGDNLFEDVTDTQDVPLALTKHEPTTSSCPSPSMNQYLQFHQQQRPGVIVVKHS
uniref:Transcription factor AP-4 n=2 Tax=Cacopsylla melanoneura TaxID=428564 RepID=A0A8D9DN46_9HEMI